MSGMVAPGYVVQVVSWENDADNYKTQTLYGLTEDDAMFYTELASKFTSENDHGNPGMGNAGHSEEKLTDLISGLLRKHTGVSKQVRSMWENSEDDTIFDAHYKLCDTVLGMPGEWYWENEENFCRVVEEIEVFKIGEVQDVTDRFAMWTTLSK